MKQESAIEEFQPFKNHGDPVQYQKRCDSDNAHQHENPDIQFPMYHQESQRPNDSPAQGGGGYNVIIQSSSIDAATRNHLLMGYNGSNNPDYSDDPQHFAREEDAIELKREIVREIKDQADKMYYPSGEGDTGDENTNRGDYQMRINIAPPPEDVRSPPQYQIVGPVDYQDIVPTQKSPQQYDIPMESLSDDNQYQAQSYQYAVQNHEMPMRASQDHNRSQKSVRFDSEIITPQDQQQQQYRLHPSQKADESLEAERQNIQMIHQDFQRHQRYSELQMMERQVVRDMNEQSQIPLNLEETKEASFPDPTSFLYKQYLVDNQNRPETYYKGSDEEKISPRTRFFLQANQQPQFALQARESEEDLNQYRAAVPQRPQQHINPPEQPRQVLSLNQMMQLRTQNVLPPLSRIGMTPQASRQPDEIRNSMHFGPRDSIQPDSATDEEETQKFQRKLAEINQITNQYEHIHKSAEDMRALHEVRHVEDMTQFYMKNFQDTEAVLKDRSEEVRQSKLQMNPLINLGEPEIDYKQPSFEINEQQERLYRPPEIKPLPAPTHLRADDGSNAKPIFMRNVDDGVTMNQSVLSRPEKQVLNQQIKHEGKKVNHSRNASENKQNPYNAQKKQPEIQKHETANSSDLLNIADPLSSIGDNEGMRKSTYRSGVSVTEHVSPTNRQMPMHVPNLPELHSQRPQTGIKLIRQMTQENRPQNSNQPSIKVKPPLPPLPTKLINQAPPAQSRNQADMMQQQRAPPQYYTQQQEDVQNYQIAPQYQTMPSQQQLQYYQIQNEQQQLPPIRQSQQQYESDSQTSIINIFNTDGDSRPMRGGGQYDMLNQHPQYQIQPLSVMNSGSTNRIMGELFERQPSSQQQQQNPNVWKNDPFAIRQQIHEKIYETSQMMKVDNDNLFIKVQQMTRSMSYIKPASYDPSQSLPPIIDLAQRQGDTPKGPNEEVKEAAINLEGTGEFQRNFRQWDRQRSTGRYDASQPSGGLAVAPGNLSRQGSDNYANMEIIKNTMNQRMTLESVRTILPPIQGNTVAVNSQAQPPAQGRNSQRLLEYLRVENNSQRGPTQQHQEDRTQHEEVKVQIPQAETPNRSGSSPLNVNEIVIPQHESPRVPPHERSQSANGVNRVNNDGHGEDHYYSSHYDEESKNEGGNEIPASFAIPRIVEHTVETPRHLFMAPQMMSNTVQEAPRLNLEMVSPAERSIAPTMIAHNNESIYEEPTHNMGIFNNSGRRRNNNQDEEEQ